mmetsp:Transcript_142337/g.361432  ORF Transcript_142337/g.361432 Transcript_142337/m.361432 type:complete len:272 (+) Transcript_142337:395-1210(+)
MRRSNGGGLQELSGTSRSNRLPTASLGVWLAMHGIARRIVLVVAARILAAVLGPRIDAFCLSTRSLGRAINSLQLVPCVLVVAALILAAILGPRIDALCLSARSLGHAIHPLRLVSCVLAVAARILAAILGPRIDALCLSARSLGHAIHPLRLVSCVLAVALLHVLFCLVSEIRVLARNGRRLGDILNLSRLLEQVLQAELPTDTRIVLIGGPYDSSGRHHILWGMEAMVAITIDLQDVVLRLRVEAHHRNRLCVARSDGDDAMLAQLNIA